MTTHSSVLAWRIPWTEEPGGLQLMRSQRVRHNRATNTHTHTHIHTHIEKCSLEGNLSGALRSCSKEWEWEWEVSLFILSSGDYMQASLHRSKRLLAVTKVS